MSARIMEFVHICVYSFQMCYTRFGAYPNHMLITIIVKKLAKKRKRKENKRKTQEHR
jgi:hypothetical protein